jgi:stress response protein YsnF
MTTILRDAEPVTGDDIVMVLSEEVPMITMSTRPYERVRIRVQQVTEERAVTEPVRREEVVVDNDVN